MSVRCPGCTTWNLLDLVKAILYLIDHPNFESPLSDFREVSMQESMATKSALLLTGLPVDGRRFTANTTWCDWARENNCLPTAGDVKEGYIWTPPKEEIRKSLDILEERENGECESVEFSTADIHLPPWRVSAGRLLHDMCHYCTKYPHLVNLVLLNPMSLSPLSPPQNVMQRNATKSGQALSSFFHVPVSTENRPSPSTLHYLGS
nr:hypothetical protein HmN_000831900 [Hymenolepis microstoma]